MSFYFDRIVKSLQGRAARAYRARFRVETAGGRNHIFDGDKPLAVCDPLTFDIWSFAPLAPDERANREPPGRVMDVHTIQNTAVNIGTQGWPLHWLARGGPEKLVRWIWLKKSGSELAARIVFAGSAGETGEWLLRIRYDPLGGRYRYTWDVHVRKLDADPMEGFNLMVAGALADRPENRRWTHSLWENADNQLRRIVHSSALFYCTDYSSLRIPEGPWRHRSAAYPQAWIGYAAHRTFNPVILVHQTNIPLTFATCSQLFDEHIIWNRAGQDNLGADGYFHFRMRVELVNLPPAQAKRLLRDATDPVQPRRWQCEQIALPFRIGQINSFETAVPTWAAEDCPILVLPTKEQWAATIAHSGRRSIRFAGGKLGQRQVLYPVGAVCRVRLQQRYRLSGWIKTRGVRGAARLELADYAYSYTNILRSEASGAVTGTRDWTRVEVELASRDAAYLLPQLVLTGTGQAWFDDVCFEEL